MSVPEGDLLVRSALQLGIAAQTRAADPTVSSWVSANAGTGKTRVLTDRVARLLLRGTDPQRLLCLTFTRAAAAEMQERLFARLGRWATMPDAELDADLTALNGSASAAERVAARRVFARALDIPGGLKIQTIHAFCEGLLRRFPVEAGVPAHFAVAGEAEAAELLAIARTEVLSAARLGAEPSSVSRALGLIAERATEADFRALVNELVSGRTWIARLRREHGGVEGLRALIRDRLGVEGASTPDLLGTGSGDATFDGPALADAAEMLRAGSPRDVRRGDAILAFLAARDRVAALPAYRAVFLTGAGAPRRTLATKALLARRPEIEDILRREQMRLLALAESQRCASVAEATEAALVVGFALLDAYEREKRRRAVLDYEDLILKTRILLRERADTAWILSKLDSGIDHVLIDEAQDTSPEQWEVIQALTEEFFAGEGARRIVRTVFAVGDEKQSIYGFQGADPRGFARMRDFFAQRVAGARFDWRHEELALSFRSTPEILKAVDLVFDQPMARAGLSSDGRPIHHTAFRAGQAGLVEIWPTIKPDPRRPSDPWAVPSEAEPGATPPSLLAQRIAGTIARWLSAGTVLPPRGRPVRPGDILILVRRRNAFVDAMVRALKARRIPVAGSDRMALTAQIAVRDLIAVGSFALMPEDDLTLAAVLRGPLIGLSEEDLFALAHGRRGTLWQALGVARSDAAAQAAALLAGVLEQSETLAPFEFYSDLLTVHRGRRKLIGRLGWQANDPVDEFLDLILRFERLEPPSLQSFLHWVELGAPELKREYEHGRDEVRIMTVHGAKGLESNIVFLPDTCGVPAPQHDPKLLATGPDGDLPLWAVRAANDPAICRAAREASRRARDEEYRRLLYVAMTRARDQLYVCGYEPMRGRAPHCWYDLILGGLMDACSPVELPFGETGWRLAGSQRAAPDDPSPPGRGGVDHADPPDWALRPPAA